MPGPLQSTPELPIAPRSGEGLLPTLEELAGERALVPAWGASSLAGRILEPGNAAPRLSIPPVKGA
eukprot:11826793-Alexandrium_andersonii.AAC.1